MPRTRQSASGSKRWAAWRRENPETETEAQHCMTLGQVLAKAKAERLCTKPACATCGAGSYRALLREAAATDAAFAAMLGELPASAWAEFAEPRGAMAFAIEALGSAELRATVLANWLERNAHPTWLYDSVVFDVLRSQSVAEPVRSRWLEAAVRVALDTHDASLVESLVWFLGSQVAERGALLRLASDLAAAVPRVRRALESNLVPGPGA